LGKAHQKLTIVIDIHPSWSGPCEMMFPTYKGLMMTIEDFEKRVDFGLVSAFQIISSKA
jgi:thiol-disulfide isomerase/thioredoxin